MQFTGLMVMGFLWERFALSTAVPTSFWPPLEEEYRSSDTGWLYDIMLPPPVFKLQTDGPPVPGGTDRRVEIPSWGVRPAVAFPRARLRGTGCHFGPAPCPSGEKGRKNGRGKFFVGR